MEPSYVSSKLMTADLPVQPHPLFKKYHNNNNIIQILVWIPLLYYCSPFSHTHSKVILAVCFVQNVCSLRRSLNRPSRIQSHVFDGLYIGCKLQAKGLLVLAIRRGKLNSQFIVTARRMDVQTFSKFSR